MTELWTAEMRAWALYRASVRADLTEARAARRGRDCFVPASKGTLAAGKLWLAAYRARKPG